MDSTKILLVDDDRMLLRVLVDVVRIRFPTSTVEGCCSGDDAMRMMEAVDFDVLVSDVRMPGMDGLALLNEVHRRHPRTSIVLMTGLDQYDLAVKALRGGAFDYIQKPVDEQYLSSTIARALHARATLLQIESARGELERRAAELEQTVEVQTHELREANRMKDEFLATLSHELRTPLTAVLGWSRLLLKGSLDDATKQQALEAIARNATQQARLIEELLDLSRIVTGKLNLSVRPINLAEIVAACAAQAEPAARAKRIHLTTSTEGKRAVVRGDRDRLEQVFGNLLSNAIKFTPENGHITIHCETVGREAVVRVSDDGVGIPADFLPHVFDRFRQGDTSMACSRSGLGLGLSISKHIITLHHGTLSAASAGPGKGASLTVHVPLSDEVEPAPLSARGSDSEPALNGVHVLVVEDDDDTRDLVRVTLETAGATVTAVGDSKVAFQAIERDRPDVVLCDIGLPGGGGYEFIRAVQASAGRHIPAAAVTAFVRNEDVERAREAGFDTHIAKPLEPATLPRAVARLHAMHVA